MSTQDLTPDVCPCIAALDRAKAAILRGDVAEFGLYLESAIGLLEANGYRSDPHDISRRVKSLYALHENARRFHAGWAALAGISEFDLNRCSVQVRG